MIIATNACGAVTVGNGDGADLVGIADQSANAFTAINASTAVASSDLTTRTETDQCANIIAATNACFAYPDIA